MKSEDFNDIVEKRFSKCKKTLIVKEAEYANSKDRLHNFKDGAFLNKQTPEQYALSLVSKQFISLRDKILLKEDITPTFLSEKVTDIINYSLLIEAIITEKR